MTSPLVGTGTGSTPPGAVEFATYHSLLFAGILEIAVVVKEVTCSIPPYRGSYVRVTHVTAVSTSVPPSHCYGSFPISCLVSHFTTGDCTHGFAGYVADTPVATGMAPGAVILSGHGAP